MLTCVVIGNVPGYEIPRTKDGFIHGEPPGDTGLAAGANRQLTPRGLRLVRVLSVCLQEGACNRVLGTGKETKPTTNRCVWADT